MIYSQTQGYFSFFCKVKHFMYISLHLYSFLTSVLGEKVYDEMVKMTPVTMDNKPPIKLKAKLHDRLTEASCILLGFCTFFREPNTMQAMMMKNPEKNY